MESVTINSATELLTHLQEPSAYMMYRGHGDASWNLLPSIYRFNLDEVGYGDWTIFQDDILEKFRKCALPFLESKPETQHDWLILAQHHGLPTVLLDWTTNPLKAIFFSVENPSYDDADGAIWAFEPSGFYTDLQELHNLQGRDYLNQFLTYLPAHITPRVIAQESCFTFFPLLDSSTPIPPLEDIEYYKAEVQNLIKFIIPKEKKRMCRCELMKLGISHLSLFPGLDGISTSIRRELES